MNFPKLNWPTALVLICLICSATVILVPKVWNSKVLSEYFEDEKKDWYIKQMKQNAAGTSDMIHDLVVKGVKCKR